MHKVRATGTSVSKVDDPVTSDDEGPSEAGGSNSKHLIEVKSAISPT